MIQQTETNSEKITQWVKSYSAMLLSWARYKVSQESLAEDLVQDTFLAAFKGIDQFDHKSSPKTWLFSILNHKIIDFYRLSVKKSYSIENENLNGVFDSKGQWIDRKIADFWSQEENLMDNNEFVSILKNCMANLPPDWKLVIEYKYIFEKNSKDICQELSISQTNYWQIVHRAKILLKTCLEKKWLHQNL